MVDYAKIKKIIKTTTITLAAGAALWVGVQQYQKIHSEKAFEKLPKAQQEIVIKLRANKTPEKTIHVNIDAYNELINITNTYNKSIDEWQKVETTIKITNIDEREIRVWFKYNHARILTDLIRTAKDLKRELTLLDTARQVDELIASMEASKLQLEAEAKELKKLKFK